MNRLHTEAQVVPLSDGGYALLVTFTCGRDHWNTTPVRLDSTTLDDAVVEARATGQRGTVRAGTGGGTVNRIFLDIQYYGETSHDGRRDDLPERYWFDADTAQYYGGDKDWNGRNNVDINTQDQWSGEGLFFTAKRRWVLHSWTSRQGERRRYRYVNPDGARTWLVFNGYEDEAVEHFGPIEDEHTPDVDTPPPSVHATPEVVPAAGPIGDGLDAAAETHEPEMADEEVPT